MAHSSNCTKCGVALYPDDRYCVSCGASSAKVAAAGAVHSNQTRAGAHAMTGIGREITCSGCNQALAADERFCPSCGMPRPGVGVVDVGAIGSRAEAAWREVQYRLEEATKGRYEILRELGRGGMAAVYLAKERTLKREVAIKVMRPNFLLDAGMVERFAREAQTMASLHHPNIVAIHSVDEVDDLHFFVMQFIAGRSLDEILKDAGPLPVAATQAILYQAGIALTHAHRAGVIHRDIKPGNIMIDRDGNAIVTDFGIAKVADVSNTSATVGAMGTPLYMSPEQCAGSTLTPASDQYALGTVAYEMLTGATPFQKPSAMALGMAIISEMPKPVRTGRPDCPEDVESAVMRMLAKAPADRWPSLTEAVTSIGGSALADDDPVREFLRSLARKEADPKAARSLTPRTPRTSGRRRPAQNSIRNRLVWSGLSVAMLTAGVLWWRGAFKPQPVPSQVAKPDTVLVPVPTLTPGPTAGDPPKGKRVDSPRNAKKNPALVPPPAAMEAALPSPAPGPAQPPIETRTPTDTATRPSVTEVKRLSHEAEIRSGLDEYVRAINARNVNQIKAVFPALSAARESQWRDIFGKDVKDVKATMSVKSVTEGENSARAEFEVVLTFTPKGLEMQRFRIACRATLESEGSSWKITDLREQGQSVL